MQNSNKSRKDPIIIKINQIYSIYQNILKTVANTFLDEMQVQLHLNKTCLQKEHLQILIFLLLQKSHNSLYPCFASSPK